MPSSVSTLLRFRWLILLGLAAAVYPRGLDSHAGDWHDFTQASRLVFDGGPGGGLHTLATYAGNLHMGPLTILATRLLQLGGGNGFGPAEVLMWALGLLTLFGLERAAVALRGLRRTTDDPWLALTVLLGGALFLKTWMTAAGGMAHLDDVLAMACTALAAWAVAARRPWLVGVAVGCATGTKAWGIMIVPLCLAFERRDQIRALGTAAVLTLAAWLPFVVAAHATVTAGSFSQANDAASGLRALGVASADTPSWVRPAQVGLALLLGALAVRRGRWPAAIAVALAVRIALDPAIYSYYTPTLVLGALVWDALGARRAFPLWTAVTFAGLVTAPLYLPDGPVLGDLRLAVSLGLAVGALVLPRVGQRTSRTRRPVPLPT